MADLEKELEENERQLQALRPRLQEQESLEQELAARRRERWQLEKYGELEAMKDVALNEAESKPPIPGTTIDHEAAMKETLELERELDEELERLRVQLETAKHTENTFR